MSLNTTRAAPTLTPTSNGAQHDNGGVIWPNPYAEDEKKVPQFSAEQIATFQSRLEKKLGPEYIDSRPGQGGKKMGYIPSYKVIELANEVFGFNGWSSAIKDVQVDFVDEKNGKYSLGLSVVMRVTLKDGTFHEDIGYGHVENYSGKALAFEKAKKEGTTDGLKRALRTFGNVLGNCIYDNSYMKEILKIRVEPKAFNLDILHRHQNFRTVEIKKEDPRDDEDEYGYAEGDFNDADFSESYLNNTARPDEVVIEEPKKTPQVNRNQPRNSSNGYGANGSAQQQKRQPQSVPNGNQSMPAPPRPTSWNNNNSIQAQNGQQVRSQAPAAPQRNTPGPQTPTPNSNNNFVRSASGTLPGPNQTTAAPRTLNQPSRQGSVPPTLPVPRPIASSTTPAVAFTSGGSGASAAAPKPPPPIHADPDFALPPGGFQIGFFSGKAVKEGIVSMNGGTPPVGNIPQTAAFNPNAESPSIRKTAGFDHSKTAGVKTSVSTGGAEIDEQARPVPTGGFTGGINKGGYRRPTFTGVKRPGHADTVMGGMGGAQAQGQLGARPVLQDMPTNTGGGLGQVYARQTSGGPEADVKRARISGP